MKTATPKTPEPELPGMPEPTKAPLRKGSKAWKAAETRRFYELAAKHGGITTAFWVALTLGVSRTRVYQLVESGVLHPEEIMGKQMFPCDEVLRVKEMHRPAGYQRTAAQHVEQVAA